MWNKNISKLFQVSSTPVWNILLQHAEFAWDVFEIISDDGRV